MNSYVGQPQPPPPIWDKLAALLTTGQFGPDHGPSDPPAVGSGLYDEPPRAAPGPPYSSQGLTCMLGLSGYTHRPFEYLGRYAFFVKLKAAIGCGMDEPDLICAYELGTCLNTGYIAPQNCNPHESASSSPSSSSPSPS
jgi:hypothetical protein